MSITRNLTTEDYLLVDTVANLRLKKPDTTGIRRSTVLLQENKTLYVWDSVSVLADNSKTVIKVAALLTGRWVNAQDLRVVGTFTVTGSSQSTVVIPHGLGITPSFTNVNPKSAAARTAGISSWTEDTTNINLTLTTPQASGSLVYSWEAKV